VVSATQATTSAVECASSATVAVAQAVLSSTYAGTVLSSNPSFLGTTSVVTLLVSGEVDFNDKQALDFILENRTDDTGMTVTGQMWFRTDV